MLNKVINLKREADLVLLHADPADGPLTRRCVRAQNFAIDWFQASQGTALGFASTEDAVVPEPLPPQCGGLHQP